MNLVQAFKMAFKSIAMKKTRSFLTIDRKSTRLNSSHWS